MVAGMASRVGTLLDGDDEIICEADTCLDTDGVVFNDLSTWHSTIARVSEKPANQPRGLAAFGATRPFARVSTKDRNPRFRAVQNKIG